MRRRDRSTELSEVKERYAKASGLRIVVSRHSLCNASDSRLRGIAASAALAVGSCIVDTSRRDSIHVPSCEWDEDRQARRAARRNGRKKYEEVKGF